MRHLVVSATILALLSGCVVAPPPRPAIPVARVEPVPPPPSERVVWQPGEWHWNGAAYAWRPGHYVERLVAYHRYEAGHWDRFGEWIPGHWV